MKKKIGLILVALAPALFPVMAQDTENKDIPEPKIEKINLPDNLEFRSYGEINYTSYSGNYQLDKYRSAYSDTNRFSVEAEYHLSKVWALEAEVEWEHHGAGSTMELDKQEEFGEYEQEIESAGETVLEELFIIAKPVGWFKLKFGRIRVPVGLTNKRYRPTQYFSASRSEAEVHIIPTVWYENGIGASGNFDTVFWDLVAINGLDSSGFSSADWVAAGYQKRFERVVHEDWLMLLVLIGDMPEKTIKIIT